MTGKINRLISFVYYFLFFFLPIIIIPITSELFEFNKLVFVYISTTLIGAFWLIVTICEKRIIFRRTILDIPLVLFLISQILATIFSIDPLTSVFGYYSRFHGGLLSCLCYAFLYWGFTSNMNRKNALITLRLIIISTLFVCLYGILEHFGIDKNLWIQDVQNRVFSTLGQPNWLAAYIIAITPLIWVRLLMQSSKTQLKSKKCWLFGGISLLFFLTLLFTKSRSGLLGFIVSDTVFCLLSLWMFKNSAKFKTTAKTLIILNSAFIILALVVGTPWTGSLKQIISSRFSSTDQSPSENPTGTVLETGGTESGEIRKIVWKGAVNVWKHYPLFGSGVETFAYSYYQFRPQEHNLVSEWDFLYNKAHNEYLNFLATSGTVGLAAYLLLIAASIYQICNYFGKTNIKSKNSEQLETKLVHIGLLAGYTSILVTNFFGFSVVTVALIFFLYPALAVALSNKEKYQDDKIIKLSYSQTGGIVLTLLVLFFLLFTLGKYWYADVLYAQGKNLNNLQNYASARMTLFKATQLSPLQAVYLDELSQSAAGIALLSFEAGDTKSAKLFAETSINEVETALNLSPANLNLMRSKASLFIKLAQMDPTLMKEAIHTLETAITHSPTDAKLYYNLGLGYARNADNEHALETLEKSVELKANYKDARIALAKLYAQKKDYQKALAQLQYILDYISPNNSQALLLLEEIKNKLD